MLKIIPRWQNEIIPPHANKVFYCPNIFFLTFFSDLWVKKPTKYFNKQQIMSKMWKLNTSTCIRNILIVCNKVKKSSLCRVLSASWLHGDSLIFEHSSSFYRQGKKRHSLWVFSFKFWEIMKFAYIRSLKR